MGRCAAVVGDAALIPFPPLFHPIRPVPAPRFNWRESESFLQDVSQTSSANEQGTAS